LAAARELWWRRIIGGLISRLPRSHAPGLRFPQIPQSQTRCPSPSTFVF
jgi:hypothetical protein